jgi:hypothetical protein
MDATTYHVDSRDCNGKRRRKNVTRDTDQLARFAASDIARNLIAADSIETVFVHRCHRKCNCGTKGVFVGAVIDTA